MVVRRVLAVSYRKSGSRMLGVVVDRTEAPASRREALSAVRSGRGRRDVNGGPVRPSPERCGPVIHGTIALLIGPA